MFERGRVVERDAQGKALRMLGVCMDLDETKVAERRANARNERVEAALQLTTAGVWDWDVEHDLTNHTDGYYRVFGVDPAFGRANIQHLARSCSAPIPDQEIERFRDRLLQRRSRRRRCSRPNTASATPTAAGTGRSIAPTSSSARRTARPAACSGLVVDITARKIRETGAVRRPTSVSAPSRASCAA